MYIILCWDECTQRPVHIKPFWECTGTNRSEYPNSLSHNNPLFGFFCYLLCLDDLKYVQMGVENGHQYLLNIT